MQFTLNVNKCWKTKVVGGLAAVLFGSLAMPGTAFADSAFIGQVGSGMIGRAPMIGFSGGAPGNSSLPPELSSPKRGGADIAGALIIGNYNRTIQLQAGSRDRSAIEEMALTVRVHSQRCGSECRGDALRAAASRRAGLPRLDRLAWPMRCHERK